MQVETFECQEVAAEPIEACEEAIEIIDSLGLEGQQTLTAKNSPQPSRSPFRVMTREETFVYSVLCPNASKLHEYQGSPIPLRVLQLVQRAHDTGVFKRFEVWDKASAVVKDPVLVGQTWPGDSSWNRTTYILARWGEELEAFAVLLKRAVAIHRELLVSTNEAALAECESNKNLIKSMSDASIVGLEPNRGVDLRNFR